MTLTPLAENVPTDLQPKPMVSFATFWAGPRVSAYEAACMASFVRHDYRYVVYTYDDIANLPAGVERADASDVADREDMARFIIHGTPNLTHFSDLFRYRLLQRTDHVWVDTDMMLLRPLPAPFSYLLAREDTHMLNNAIMRLERGSPELIELIQCTEQLRDRELAWGATGPQLLTRTFRRKHLYRQEPAERFFPIHYDDFWKMFLPEFNEKCEALSVNASTVHLWNNRIVMLGVWKRYAPPVGSFLWNRFHQVGATEMCEAAYPADVMRNMVYNWRARCGGGEIEFGRWLRRAWPSAVLTFRRRLNLPV